MVVDNKGNILTDAELKRMFINGITININDTNKLMRHFDALIDTVENTSECVKANKKFDRCMEEIKTLLPEDKKQLLVCLEDSCTEILVLHEEYFYKSGYYDSIKANSIVKRLCLWIARRF